MGVIECVKHDLVEPYPIYFEKEGEFVAEFKYTVLIMPNGTTKITGLPIDLEMFETENKITDESINVSCPLFVEVVLILDQFAFFCSKALLSKSTSLKSQRKKKKKQAKKTDGSKPAAAGKADNDDDADEEDE